MKLSDNDSPQGGGFAGQGADQLGPEARERLIVPAKPSEHLAQCRLRVDDRSEPL
ncbi:MAG: hypothetical protein HZB38_15270 [Planctomycetes bacterium]|nr:hypothetical protein [Planctomycetota bacterium]